jgi:hypothetical protein
MAEPSRGSTPSRDPEPTPVTGSTETETGTESAPRDAPDPLLAWGLASFHAAVLLVVPLWVGHAVAPVALGGLLDGLDTLVGVALFLVLWGSTWWSNRRYLATSALETPRGTVVAGAKWGAATGLPLLGCVVLAALVATSPVFAAVLLVAGSVVAPFLGAVVGAVLAGVDVVFDRLAGTLVP